MKKLFSFSFLLFISLNISLAQTNVSGFINANTTWSIAGSPYIIVGNTIVLNGYTLTINPGVVVKFNSSTALQVQGELIAVGMAANRIIFTANQATPYEGYWACILLSNTSVDAQYDTLGNYVSGSIMKYCDVLYGGGNDFGSIHAESCYPHIANCKIAYSSTAGIYSLGSVFNIDSTRIENCAGIGMEFRGGWGDTCIWHLQYDTVQNNEGGGIYIEEAHCPSGMVTATISHNYIKNNNGSGGFYCESADLILSENIFENNTCAVGSFGSAIYIKTSTYIVECNLVKNNYISNSSNIVDIESYYTGNNIIRHNTFEGNIDSVGIFYRATLYVNTYNPVPIYISNNLFSNNSQPSSYICQMYAASIFSNTSFYYVDSNEFRSNQSVADIFCQGSSSNTLVHTYYINYNNFIDTASQYAVYNSLSSSGPNIEADNNYWNSTSMQHIDSVIYDYSDNLNHTIVDYNPILTSPVLMGVPCNPVIITAVNHESNGSSNVTIYPNPAHSSFTIQWNEKFRMQNAELKIYDVMGREVHSQAIRNQETEIRNLNLTAGIYFVKVTGDGEKSVTQKLVIQ